MHTPLHQLRAIVGVGRHHSRDRWDTDQGEKAAAIILDRIEEGALGDFLNDLYYNAALEPLTSPQDLSGFRLSNLKFVGPDGNDHFKYSDLSHSSILGCSFTDASFFGTVFNHADLAQVTFTQCTFVDVSFYGADLDEVKWERCDFISAAFKNADFHRCTFTSCYVMKAPFSDCRFDGRTTFTEWRTARLESANPKADAKVFDIGRASLWSALQEGYAAGGIGHQARHYFFEQNLATTRHNVAGREQVVRFAIEATTGYGVKPLRALLTLGVILALSTGYFWLRYGPKGPLLAAGAFFTFGAENNVLANAPPLDLGIYIGTAALGIAGIAAFVAIVFNTLLRYD